MQYAWSLFFPTSLPFGKLDVYRWGEYKSNAARKTLSVWKELDRSCKKRYNARKMHSVQKIFFLSSPLSVSKEDCYVFAAYGVSTRWIGGRFHILQKRNAEDGLTCTLTCNWSKIDSRRISITSKSNHGVADTRLWTDDMHTHMRLVCHNNRQAAYSQCLKESQRCWWVPLRCHAHCRLSHILISLLQQAR